MATSPSEKVRENRLRRAAERQGLALSKSRRRDPRALDYGTYTLTDLATREIVSDKKSDLDDIERYLTSDEPRGAR